MSSGTHLADRPGSLCQEEACGRSGEGAAAAPPHSEERPVRSLLCQPRARDARAAHIFLGEMHPKLATKAYCGVRCREKFGFSSLVIKVFEEFELSAASVRQHGHSVRGWSWGQMHTGAATCRRSTDQVHQHKHLLSEND